MGWIKNGVFALALAGLYSIILVMLRTPYLNQLFSDQSIFKSALIIHVNLSVLVWLMSITAFIWRARQVESLYSSLYVYISFVSIILMSISPLFSSNAIMNNYIPMLESVVFVVGLCLFGSVLLCFAVETLFYSMFIGEERKTYGERIISIAQFTTSFLYILVWVCFALSYQGLDNLSNIVPLDLDYYYEMLFWSGGHLLQYIYTQILMLVLLVLLEVLKGEEVRYSNAYEMLMLMNFVLGLLLMLGHFYFDISDGEFKEFFTLHMIYCSGIAPTLFIALLVFELLQTRKVNNKVAFAAFLSSITIFLSGGLIGAFISGVNVTIPAHYHGSIVGISIAFMGLVYLILFSKEKLGLKAGCINRIYQAMGSRINKPKDKALQKIAVNQIYIISSGQLLHVLGLAMAGGYGVMRKSPGEEILLSAKIYMGMVGAGGLLAIIGGLMFVYVCAKNLILIK